MPSAVEGLAQVRDRLRRRGFRVTEVDGWQTRGKGTLRPQGFVWHHTAIQGTGRTRGLRTVTFGREGLRNSLSAWYDAVDGELFLVAALVSWHAGRGGWRGLSGNTPVLGCEWESDGTTQRATPEAYASMLALAQESSAVFGFGPEMHCEHKQWQPGKVDRFGFSGPAWQEAIAIGNPPAPAPPPIEEEDDVPTLYVHPDGHTYILHGSRLSHVPYEDRDTWRQLSERFGPPMRASRALLLNLAGRDTNPGGVWIP